MQASCHPSMVQWGLRFLSRFLWGTERDPGSLGLHSMIGQSLL